MYKVGFSTRRLPKLKNQGCKMTFENLLSNLRRPVCQLQLGGLVLLLAGYTTWWPVAGAGIALFIAGVALDWRFWRSLIQSLKWTRRK